MARDTCRYLSCNNEPGKQDRNDYNSRLYCSVKCEVKHEHIKADAREVRAEERR